MPEIEIITIGTELLLGAIQDTNTAFIAQHLNNAGFEIHRATIVGDNAVRIAESIKDALERADVVITTGGLGPTVDDPTRDAVALAFGVELEFHPELWDQIKVHFSRMNRIPSENNKKQSFLPSGAEAIPNPIGTAPAFVITKQEKTCVSLPGVPAEMKHLLLKEVVPRLNALFVFESTITYRVVHTAGIGESALDELISDLEELSNPTVGLSAHPSQVDIRVTAKAQNKAQALNLINPIVNEIIRRLHKYIYGFDGETLSGSFEKLLLETRTGISFRFTGDSHFPVTLINKLRTLGSSEVANQISVDLALTNVQNVLSLSMRFNSADQNENENRTFIQHISQFERWSENVILNFIRENLIKMRKNAT